MSVESSQLQIALELGMNEQEYHNVVKILGREPSGTELAMYSVEWSEHCGYPRSRPLLKLFPKTGKYPTRAEGEDAGGIEIEDGVYVLFKMESHNHPSQVEPKQGAATGIGGILRDIFTMGARPVALMDSLRFGDLDTDKAKFLLHGVVDGIQFYGNCVGVPTVGGEIYFHPSYRDNCLVNVMAVGIGKTGSIATSKGKGPGNPVLVVGNRTGRDGIGGCSILASHEFSEDDEKRPTVQIGDPFTEKCLIEACMEVLQGDAIVGIKDMGAAGITCTTAEMAASGGVGMDIDLAKVPMREEGMEPWEIMMSESQERMLVVAKKGREDEVVALFEKWNLNAAVVGEVLEEEVLRIRFNGELVAEVPSQSLAAGPVYQLPNEAPSWIKELNSADLSNLPLPADYNKTLLSLLSSPSIASKQWVFEQYDHMVQTNTVIPPGAGDAAVIRVKGISKGIGISTDCNSRYCYLDPYIGAQIAVAEAARNLVCVGADPAAVTDCLNFGKPEKPDRFWQLKRGVEGIADACRAFRVPVVSGNVSLYNEGPEAAVYPTPTIGMIGVLDKVEQHCTLAFKSTGHKIALVGVTKPEVGGSEYLAIEHGKEVGVPPTLDLDAEIAVQNFVLTAIQQGLLASAHDCAEGGLAVTIAESAIAGKLGADIAVDLVERPDMTLFAESQSRIVVSFDIANESALSALAKEQGVPFKVIGTVGGDQISMKVDGDVIIDMPFTEVTTAYTTPIFAAMGE
ncbi:MAG TPA: phosphoribosylformylglycinamidine synthase subunit PurL [Armatimonadota bacterium]|nr:phosphoribosylformylglycinamidine synthase subunit PurL [Armatimonadota bacterium]